MQNIQTPTLPKITIVDDVVDMDCSTYDAVIEAFVAGITCQPGVLYIGQMGHIRTPGVSDIDLFIICEDDCYPALRRTAQSLIETIPDAAYCFTHQVFVLPKSLAPDRCTLFFEHIVDDQKQLYGDRTLIDQAQLPSKELNALIRMIWNTTLFNMLQTSSTTKGLRSVLLLLQSLTNHSAINAVCMGDDPKPILQDGKKMRSDILADSVNRTRSAKQYLERATQQFLDLESTLQTWWQQTAFIERTDQECYTFLSGALQDAFSPYLTRFPKPDISALTPAWQHALQTYEAAVHRAKNVALSQNQPPYDLFFHNGEGIFPSPFNSVESQETKSSSVYSPRPFPFRNATYFTPRQLLEQRNISFADYAQKKNYYGQMGELFEQLCPRLSSTEEEVMFLLSQAKNYNPDAQTFLDIACGVGRHARLLSEHGFHTVGVDASTALLEQARTQDAKSTYVEGDMRTFQLTETFDCAICMWDAYPYLSQPKDLSAFLERCFSHLNDQGVLILDSRNFQKPVEQELTRHECRIDMYHIEVIAKRKTYLDERVHEGIFTSIIQDTGTGESAVIVDQELVRTYSTEEVSQALTQHGFTCLAVHGDFDGTSYDPKTSLHQIIIAQKHL